MKTLDDLKIGQTGFVAKLGSSGALRRRIIDMGITPGTSVKKLKTAPFGDPVVLLVRGYRLSLRRSEAKEIFLTLINQVNS